MDLRVQSRYFLKIDQFSWKQNDGDDNQSEWILREPPVGFD